MEISLKNKNMVCLIDEEDFDLVKDFEWYAHDSRGKWYAACYINKTRTFMHRLLLQAPKEKEVDHRDGNGLNNHRLNLRLCTHSQNGKNRKTSSRSTSGYPGVTWHKRLHKWRAWIWADGKRYSLGCFTAIEDAAKAYEDAAKKLFGEFKREEL